MSRNRLKHFPTAFLRRGLAQFHPGGPPRIQPPVDPSDLEPARLSHSPASPPPASSRDPVAPGPPIHLIPKRVILPEPALSSETAEAQVA